MLFFPGKKWQRIGTNSKNTTAIAKHYDFHPDSVSSTKGSLGGVVALLRFEQFCQTAHKPLAHVLLKGRRGPESGHRKSGGRVVADVWEKGVWDFQAKSGSSGSCGLSGESTATPDSDTFEKYRDTPPISIAILVQKYALLLA